MKLHEYCVMPTLSADAEPSRVTKAPSSTDWSGPAWATGGVCGRGEKVSSAGQDQIASDPERRPGVCPEIRPIVSAGKSQTDHEVETMDARRIQPVVLQGVQTGLGRMERDARILPDRGRLGGYGPISCVHHVERGPLTGSPSHDRV